MDFYRINEDYNKFLQKYEKKKRGVTKVPNIRYTDHNKFAFGAVMQVKGLNYLILRILKTGISLEAMPPWVSENGFSSFQAVC